MGLSLNNIYQRPYVKPDTRRPVRQRDDEEKSSAAGTQREGENGQNAKSRGLDYVEQKTPVYTPAYEQRFSLPAQNAYNNVNINTTAHNEQTAAASAQVQEPAANTVNNNKINIAQILKDFKNTAIAIGTPDDLSEIVNGYLEVVQKQASTGHANQKLVKNTLTDAASILDNYISETLNKDSKVVENWVDALFLQNIDLNYDEESINERFLVKFPDGSTSRTKRQEELQETAQETAAEQHVQEESPNVIPISVAGSANKIPQDKMLKSLFIQAKKYAYANNPEQAIKSFEQALNRALEIDDTETSGKIYYEVGKIYDDHDYIPQALKSYNQSIKLSTDENVKTKAHYSMAQIYDDVNQISPAIDHYFSTVSHAGEADNLPAQSASLTKLGNIYSDMYEKQAFDYYSAADEIAQETDNNHLKGFVASNEGNAYKKFDEPEKALKSYSKAVKNYTSVDAPLKTAQNYLASADIMVEYNAINKALNLLNKARKYARQTDNINLMSEINTKINQLNALAEGVNE